MNIQSSKHVLLTGAGFTKNFGTPLASEMWAEIFNHKKIQAHPKIKKLMLDEKVLSQNQRRLLIVGYSFGDYHINGIISNALRNHRLKIYIISPVSPEEFKKKLCEKPGLSLNIWQEMLGYFQSNLKDIFSENRNKSQAIKQHFYDVFFESF